MHRRVLVRQELEESDPLFHPVLLNPDAQHLLLAAVMGPFTEGEPAALLRAVDAPACEDPRDGDHVLLSVAAVHAECVQLEQLTGVVLVDTGRNPTLRSPS